MPEEDCYPLLLPLFEFLDHEQVLRSLDLLRVRTRVVVLGRFPVRLVVADAQIAARNESIGGFAVECSGLETQIATYISP